MATSAETRVVNAAGVVQGIALVTFPAASTILTDPSEYDLSSSQYGALFLPQVVTAITAALLGASLSGRFGTKRVYMAGLCAGLVVDDPAPRQRRGRGRLGRVPAAAPRHRDPRGGLRPHGARAEHADRGLPSGRPRPRGPRAERPPRLRHGARAGVRRDLRRARRLVGPAAGVRDPPRRARARQRAPAAGDPRCPARRRRRRHAASRGGSGSTQDSRSSTASARRSTATGRSST